MDKHRDNARLATVIYVLALLVTLAVVFLIGLPFARISHAWISLFALFIAETALYGLSLYYIPNRKHSDATIPGYLAFGTIAGLYLIVVIIFIIVFSLVLDLSTFNYGLLHFIALGVAGIMASMVAIYFRHADDQEVNSTAQVQWVSGMRSTLLSIKQELAGWNHEERGGLAKGIAELEEKVRYSDPVSHPSLVGTEESLMQQVHELASGISSLVKETETTGETERVGRQIRETMNLLESRNQRLLQLK
ncbi:hypothetical protein [Cohnella silvisoli]|uniref:MFS transporter n=1 Tax=Cohnella silvisoli TaxID=2873699 RepID=A0ABV1KZL9_9BACL|nr:hypothetical protein [Cohnella silvisoli]MCD9024807.1 hypothetical protein [Cohnella silvisoli]